MCALDGGHCVCCMGPLLQELRTGEIKLELVKSSFICSPALQKGR